MPDGLSYTRAKAFRRRMTPPEARLWRFLRAHRLKGYGFRRQHPIGPFILDFYCAGARLAVEVDGAVHDDPDQIERDRRRTAWLVGRVFVWFGCAPPRSETRSRVCWISF